MTQLKSDYHFDLPEELIAQKPAEPRDSSRMMCLNRTRQSIHHDRFSSLADYLEEGSVLVINNSKVIPARLPGFRKSGGAIEALLISQIEPGLWLCKLKNVARIKIGETLSFCEGVLMADLVYKGEEGCHLRFDVDGAFYQKLEQFGHAPLPPYIRKARREEVARSEDLEHYQTLFAKEYGAVAAPTAGLHFTEEVLHKIQQRGIELVPVTLHVGLGTFEPMRTEVIEEHKMHYERYEVTFEASLAINKAKSEGRKVVAVGTTATRTLESAWNGDHLQVGSQRTNIFIYPPYRFQCVDQLLTNFHLPESTLIMLISAFAGKDFVARAYRTAIQERYRFYSYGDCMLIQ